MTKKAKFGKPLCRAIMAVAMMMLSLQAMAYQFSYTHQGKTLYYNATSDSTVEVTYCVGNNDNYIYVSGDVVIPSTITCNGTTYSVTSIGRIAFLCCDDLITVSIPNSVTSIGERAFDGCNKLTSVNIPNSVTSIERGVFRYCSDLTSIDIPSSVTSIGELAFEYCWGLTSVNIPNSVTSIGKSAFYGCSGLTSVSIPNSITSIGNETFEYCNSLTSVTIPNSVTSIGDDAFKYCRRLTSVTFGTGVTSIGEFAFSNCDGLTSVSIPNSVTSIAWGAFSSCRGLTSVSIGTGVTSIGENAFYYCRVLASVKCSAPAPPSVGSSSFASTSSTCTLTVSCVSLDAYIESDWNTCFGGRILNDTTEEFPFEVIASANDLAMGSVDINNGERCNQRILTATPASCYRFVAWSDNNTDNPRTIRVTQDTTLIANFERAVYTQAISHVICEGSAYTENGFNASEAGTYTRNLQTINGCDSIVTLNLSVNPVANTNLTAAICEGSSYTENSFNVSEAGTYTQNLQTINGCDSIVTLNLSVNPVANTNLAVAICEGSAYTENGFNVSEAGTYTQTLHTVNGCDSIVTLTLSVNPVESTNLTAAICEGSSYTENGFNVSEAGTYTQNLQTVNGCDSVVTLNLTVNPVESTNLTAAICEGSSYTENGFNVSEAGTYTQTLQTVNGCDSTVTLNLTVNPVYDETINAAICEGTTYTENGFNVSEAGTYTQTLQTINGCDSTVTLNLTVNPVYDETINAAICEGTTYTENGFNVSEAGTYTQTLQTINGCDSIVTLNLSVNPVESTTLSAAICEGTSYTENGFNASEAGTYTQNLQTVNGCDSIVTLNLTINPVESTTLSAAICEGTTYTENGFNVSEAGTYTQNLQTVNGCDSIVTLNLTINPVESTTLSAAICEGTTYTENGFNVSEAGTYTQNLQTVNGCDSIVTLNLTINPVADTTIAAAICEGEIYYENGFMASSEGTHTQILQTENGCDSVVTLNLTVYPAYQMGIGAVIHEGETYDEYGFNVNEEGTYTQILQTVNGCDSIITLNVVLSSLDEVEANDIKVNVYPNPANAYTVLEAQGLKEEIPVYLFDIQGRKVREYVMKAGQETLRIDVSDLPKGVYTITIGNTTKKLIVE